MIIYFPNCKQDETVSTVKINNFFPSVDNDDAYWRHKFKVVQSSFF